jgi:hypothetical protein
MSKNFLHKLKESLTRTSKKEDFEKAKEVLFSCKDRDQLVSAVKFINNFNRKHGISEKSPEFIYFEKMIRLMKKKVSTNRYEVDKDIDEGQRMKSSIITKIIKESLSWEDKDEINNNDEYFSSDKIWSPDENWSTNPDRSYWKQGSVDGSSGADVNESDDLEWMKDVSDKLPSINERSRIPLKNFMLDVMLDNEGLLNFLYEQETFMPSDSYVEEMGEDEFINTGIDRWLQGEWKDPNNSVWVGEPDLSYWEILEQLLSSNSKWDLITEETESYNLEYSSYENRIIYQNKSNKRFYALNYEGNVHDGIEGNYSYLYEVFEQKIIAYM